MDLDVAVELGEALGRDRGSGLEADPYALAGADLE